MRMIDLFCGIGGFHIAGSQLGFETVFASDIDETARHWYERNTGIEPAGNIWGVKPEDIPDHDLLAAGLPCQPWSRMGQRKGDADSNGQGNLFWAVHAILEEKRPPFVVLENVVGFATLDEGRPFESMLFELEKLEYYIEVCALDAMDYGVPQARERLFVICRTDKTPECPYATERAEDASEIIEDDFSRGLYRSAKIRARFKAAPGEGRIYVTNRGGKIRRQPMFATLRSKPSSTYMLIDGERRPSVNELFAAMGFPGDWDRPDHYQSAVFLSGNAVVPSVAYAAMKEATS